MNRKIDSITHEKVLNTQVVVADIFGCLPSFGPIAA